MLDPEASRQTAHVFLDAAAIYHPKDSTSFEVRDDMTELAIQRLREVGSIGVSQDDETSRVSVDMSTAVTGIIAVISACVQGWAKTAGVDRDLIISEVRNIIDTDLAGGDTAN